MNHEYVEAGNLAVAHQIQAVPEQSAVIRALDAKVRIAAGWRETGFYDGAFVPEGWTHKEPLPLKIRVKSTGAVLLTGYEIAREKVLSGIATLVEETQ